jgi:hypothetical protein
LAVARAAEAGMARLLTRTQQKRLEQIALQQRGLMAFREARVVAALGLTASQKLRIREIEAETFFIGPGRRGPGPKRERGKEARSASAGRKPEAPARGPRQPWLDGQRRMAEAVRKCVALLNEEQTRQWQELVGKPFAGPVPLGPFGPPRPR